MQALYILLGWKGIIKMNIYETLKIDEYLKGNSYAGRGILLGCSADGTKAVSAYFIMGRSDNSRNRIFIENREEVVINAFDPSKLEDPTLIIYSPVKRYKDFLIVTNGDQTDTIYDYIHQGKTFEEALETREFEPDAPNLTPRISGMAKLDGKRLTYKMSILKSADKEGTACNRFTFSYEGVAGVGHFIHTYNCDGNPLPTFTGEPKRIAITEDIQKLTDDLWSSLNEENKISLYVRYTDIASGKWESRLINKNK